MPMHFNVDDFNSRFSSHQLAYILFVHHFR